MRKKKKGFIGKNYPTIKSMKTKNWDEFFKNQDKLQKKRLSQQKLR